MNEIREAIRVLEGTGNQMICVLHCISIYPPEISTIRLNNIAGLRKEFPMYPIGFSDHSIGIEMPVASIALGACLIEKHFTLDKSKIGMDNQVATEPDEMKEMVEKCNNIFIALGDEERKVLPAEQQKREEMRRSVVASKDLKEGDTLSMSDLDVKRPGTGIPAHKIYEIVGKKLNKDIKEDYVIYENDLC